MGKPSDSETRPKKPGVAQVSELIDQEDRSGVGPRLDAVVMWASAFGVLVIIYYSTLAFLPAMLMRYGVAGVGLTVLFLTVRARKGQTYERIPWYDYLLILAGWSSLGYFLSDWENIFYRLGTPNTEDLIFGIIIVLVALEACRRTIGWVLVILVGIAVLYAFLGPYMPGVLAHRGYSVDRIVNTLAMSADGMFGFLMQVMVSIVLLFVIFGTVLERTGAGNWYIQIALVFAGRFASGPAVGAVAASGIFGSINGLGTANVATTGVITIPLMKKRGYPGHIAGGIEAAASTGGQLLPPVMGSTAFVMAEFTGIPYRTIALYSIIPALLYFAGIIAYVVFQANRLDISKTPTAELPGFVHVVKGGYWHVLPLATIVVMLFGGYSVRYAAIMGMLVSIGTNVFDRKARLGIFGLARAFADGVKNSLAIMTAIMSAGMLLGVMAMTGLGLKLTNLVVNASGGYLIVALLLVFLVSLVFGMGLPIVAAYILVAPFAAPALVELGVPLLVAHLVIMWFSVDSNVTPPIALAGYVAGAIANANIIKTSVEAWKAAKGLYLIPLFMVYSGLLFTEGVWVGIKATVLCFFAVIALSAAFVGTFIGPLRHFERAGLTASMLLLVFPSLTLSGVGLVLFALVVVSQLRRREHMRETVDTSVQT